MSKSLRYAIGLGITGITTYDITTINTLRLFQNGALQTKRILTITKLPFFQPVEGDLVLTLDNKIYSFRLVETGSGKYTELNKSGMSMLVPRGFLMLKDPENGVKSLECFGSVVGIINFDITWLTSLWSSN